MNPADVKAELERQIAALDVLLGSEGWAIFDTVMASSETASYEEAVKAPSAETAKHLAAHNAIKDLRSWPFRQRAMLLHRLKVEGKSSTPR